MTAPSMLAGAKAMAVLRAEDLGRARSFYADTLGLEVEDAPDGSEFRAMAGDGTAFSVYVRPGMPAPQNTTLGFMVDDIAAAMADLRSRGIVFQEYDMPEIGLKTVDGVATMGDTKVAWFEDSEGNILMLGTM